MICNTFADTCHGHTHFNLPIAIALSPWNCVVDIMIVLVNKSFILQYICVDMFISPKDIICTISYSNKCHTEDRITVNINKNVTKVINVKFCSVREYSIRTSYVVSNI